MHMNDWHFRYEYDLGGFIGSLLSGDVLERFFFIEGKAG